MPTDILQFDAKVEIEAAAGGDKPATVVARAYGGGVLSIGGNRYVIAIDGLALPATVPLLRDHANEVGSIVGSVRPAKKDNVLVCEGVLARGTPAADQVIALSQAGVELGVSVGVEPEVKTYIAVGQTVQANGKTFTADGTGLVLVTKSNLREISLCPVGADRTATARIAASSSRKGTTNMEEEFVVSDATQEMLQANFASGMPDPALEERRMRLIKCWGVTLNTSAPAELQARATELREKAIAGEISLDQLRLGSLEILRAERPKGPRIYASSRDIDCVACSAAALLLKAGYAAAAERQFDEPILHAADQMRKGNLLDFAAECLRAEGIEKPQGREAMVRAAFSTVSMPQALGLAGEKILLDAFREAPAPWREWCKTVSVASFREHTLLRPSFLGGFAQLPSGGEISHGSVGEETATIKADTYAKLLQIDRQQIINDDAGAFGEAASAMGKAAARKLNDLVVSTLLDGVGSAFFSEARSNLLDAPLSVDAVATAIAAMRSQVDADGGCLDLLPRVLLVGPALESLAIAICNSDFVGVTDGSPTGNSLKGLLIPVVEPRLASVALGGTATTWAVLGAPADSPQAVAFLNGQESPTIETLGLDADVNHLAFSWRAYFDFGTSLVDWRAGVLSSGVGV